MKLIMEMQLLKGQWLENLVATRKVQLGPMEITVAMETTRMV
ncbi:hypothetical protein A2U01_0111335, partial [Trifolium medium]|nr:hypothetical protein [Trifolium medium]